jgi:hypothetical protein
MRRMALVVVVSLIAVPAAGAKDGVLFDRTRAHLGDRVVLASSWNAHPTGLVAYLVPMAKAARFWHIPYQGSYAPNSGPPPAIRGVVRLGRLHATGRAVRLVFAVPHVPPGVYVLGLWCIPCNEHWTTALPNFQPNPLGMLRVVA